MAEMTETEMRELDAWIIEFVFKFKRLKKISDIGPNEFFWNKGHVLVHHKGNEVKAFSPTESNADAMLVLERCATNSALPILVGVKYDGWYCLSSINVMDAANADGYETLPLAIALFARKLFSDK